MKNKKTNPEERIARNWLYEGKTTATEAAVEEQIDYISAEELRAYQNAEGDFGLAKKVSEHLEKCATCREDVKNISNKIKNKEEK